MRSDSEKPQAVGVSSAYGLLYRCMLPYCLKDVSDVTEIAANIIHGESRSIFTEM